MNRSRLIYIAILGVALMVLGWDKFINPSPVTEPQAGQAQTSPPKTTTDQNSVSQWTHSPFVRRILNQQKRQSTALNENKSRDLFVPSPLFKKRLNTNTTKQVEKSLNTYLHLTSISKGSDKDRVLINGEVVKIGEAIGRYRLIEINREDVVLHVDTQHITLPIDNLTSSGSQEKVKKSRCNLSNCFIN